MNKIKISYRGPVVWNIIVFILFSMSFLILQEVFIGTSSILDKNLVANFLRDNIFVAVMFLLTAYTIFTLNSMAKLFYWSSVALTFFLTVINLYNEFSKFIIVILFFYLLFSYYLFQFFIQDKNESYYNPLFQSDYLFEPMCKKIPVTLLDGNGNPHLEGHLTNWSDAGFFVSFTKELELKGVQNLKINFEGVDFEVRARKISQLKGTFGYGFKAEKPVNKNLNWFSFMNIVKDRGFNPELLR